MRGTAFFILSALCLASCSPSGDSTVGNTSISVSPRQSWKDFMEETIDRWFEVEPGFAVYQGRHDFDGRLPDWSEDGLRHHSRFLKDAIQQARAYGNLSKEEQFERDYLIKVAEAELFWLEDADWPHRNPAYYINSGLDPNVYVARDYAEPERRMQALVRFFNAVPAAAEQIRGNLALPLPASFVEYGVNAFGGLGDYYSKDARAAFAEVKDPALQRQLAQASANAAKAMYDLRDWMVGQRKKATQDFALGPERFARMLKTTEAVDISLDRLEEIGRADLARNRAALVDACARFAPGQPVPACIAKMNANKPEGGPVAAARRQIPDLIAFVKEKDLVTIPRGQEALVRESPPYNRQNSAYIDPPGPYEKGIPSIYYISPPDPSWSPEVQRDYIPGKADLLFTSVHEVMPGHFLQFLHANRSDFLFGRLFVGYAFAEGWAHYAEELVWEAGLNDGDPETHVGQISNALLRNCRFLAAIGLHARGMSQDDARKMFVEQCFQDEGNARQQAARGTYDPAYLNYTLGKLMIRRLRADWTSRHGGRKSWKQFHDRFLSYGGPPIPLVRQQMMGEAKPRALF